MIRWSYIIPRLIFILIVYLFFYFAFDSILKWGMIKTLQSVFEAKVEIGQVKTTFLNPTLEIDALKVGNKDKEFSNLFEFQKLRFSFLLKPIFEKKFVVNEASVKGLFFDTPRKTSCKIYIPKTRMPEFVKKYLDLTKDFAADRLSDIKSESIKNVNIELSSLKSLKLIKEIEEKYNLEYKNIDEKINFSKYDDRIKDIENKFANLKKEKNLIKQIKLAKELKKEIDSFYKDFNKDKNDVLELINQARDYYKEIDEARKEDIDKIMVFAKIPKIDSDSISKMLMGRDVINKLDRYYSIALMAKNYIPDNPRKRVFEEKRKRGRVIHFVKENNYPNFLVKLAGVDGVLTPENPISYRASIENLTTQPAVYNKPLKIKLSGKKDKSLVEVNSDIDLVNKMSLSEIKYSGAKISGISYSADKIKIDIPSAYLDAYLVIKTSDSFIDAKINSIFRDVVIKPSVNIVKYENLNNAISNSLSNLKTFSTNVKISGEFSKPNISIKTDLADIISKSLESSFKKEIDNERDEIRKKIDFEISKNKEKIDDMIKSKQKELKDKLNLNSDRISKRIEEIQKSIEKNIRH